MQNVEQTMRNRIDALTHPALDAVVDGVGKLPSLQQILMRHADHTTGIDDKVRVTPCLYGGLNSLNRLVEGTNFFALKMAATFRHHLIF